MVKRNDAVAQVERGHEQVDPLSKKSGKPIHTCILGPSAELNVLITKDASTSEHTLDQVWPEECVDNDIFFFL